MVEIVLEGGSIVTDVAKHVRLGADALPAPVEIHPGGGMDDPFYQSPVVDAENIQRRQDSAQVFNLGRTLQIHFLKDPFPIFPEWRKFIFSYIEVRVRFHGLGRKDRESLGRNFADEGWDTRFEDTRLFGRNRFQRMAEQVAMVQADTGHDAQVRGDDVGRIQPSAEPGFNDCDINLLLLEPGESHSCGNLEKGQVEPV